MEISQENRTTTGSNSNGITPVVLDLARKLQTGRLDVRSGYLWGSIWFERGEVRDAMSGDYYGETAVVEILTWGTCDFRFFADEPFNKQTVFADTQVLLFEAEQFKQQFQQLLAAGLVYESVIVPNTRDQDIRDIEKRLTSGYKCNFESQLDLLSYLHEERTLADLVRDLNMDKHDWAPVLANLTRLGLVQFRPPRIVSENLLDFIGTDANKQYDRFYQKLLKPETGLLDWRTFLFLLTHEYKRYRSQRRPLSLIVFDLGVSAGLDHNGERISTASTTLTNIAEANGGANQIETSDSSLPFIAWKVAMARIALLTKQSDVLGHFMNDGYAIMLPDTTGSQAMFVAEQIAGSLTRAPLSQDIADKALDLAFGVASIPFDGSDLQALFQAATQARYRARRGANPVSGLRS